jgi:hypothetical protein
MEVAVRAESKRIKPTALLHQGSFPSRDMPGHLVYQRLKIALGQPGNRERQPNVLDRKLTNWTGQHAHDRLKVNIVASDWRN